MPFDLIIVRIRVRNSKLVQKEVIFGFLEEALARAIGISGIVRKTRTVFIYQGQTRVHLDRVDGLGDFLEFEVCLTDDQTVQEGQQIADDLLQLLNVRKCALIKGAYFDHLTK
uniref:CYTH domain-containing protein n=1 Tax=Globodera pallida TaxID=36090 RepID=A0A183CH27_GLOPA